MRAAVLALLALACACSRPEDLAVASPDGRHTASVRNHWSIDPPAQSLWIDDERIARLSEDQDWCRTIVWSRDGSTVAFLVQDANLIAADAVTRRNFFRQWLVDRDGYPTSQLASGLRLSDDGRTASFRVCPRRRGECSEPRTVALDTE